MKSCIRPVHFFILILLLKGFAFADARENSNTENSADSKKDIIDVYLKEEITADYHDKKSNWSIRFSPGFEKMLPDGYVSPADGNSYSQVFGSNEIQMVSAELGAQYNTKLGGLYLDFVYGKGGVGSSAALLTVEKYGINFGLFMDSLFANPWVSPFVGGQALYLNWKETDINIDASGKTALTTAFVAGIAIHLNRIDSQAALDSYSDYGLKNTFLDIYGIKYNTSNSANDPEFKTAFNLGVGFRLQF